MTEYSIPTANSVPEGITWGPDGNLWFTEEAGKIARITTAGTITEYSTPAGVSPVDIALGADGNLWFTELNENKIAEKRCSMRRNADRRDTLLKPQPLMLLREFYHSTLPVGCCAVGYCGFNRACILAQ